MSGKRMADESVSPVMSCQAGDSFLSQHPAGALKTTSQHVTCQTVTEGAGTDRREPVSRIVAISILPGDMPVGATRYLSRVGRSLI
jgi:hypothetical protein